MQATNIELLPTIPVAVCTLSEESIDRQVESLFNRGDRIFMDNKQVTQADYDEWSRQVYEWADRSNWLHIQRRA